MDGMLAGARAGVAVRLRGVAKDFGGPAVLQGLDLDIPAGQFLAIVGRSGCGKSTLLRLVAGLEAPGGGTLTIGGPGEDAPPADAVRLMFQEPRLLPWASIQENVEVGLARGTPPALRQVRARATLAEVGLADRAAEWPSVLSGGQKQRVALARALVSRPRLLALDEPLGALDALTRIEMQALVEQVWRAEGFTAVLVTHDVAEAVALADRVVVLDRGRVALDLPIDVPRPRRHGDPALAATEARILDRLLADGR
ncbi:ABC transporter ATP-binding protein [Paracraurococcus ruber]|uniref:Aliphatic sulfonate ABC transporter ATP-binding protein n=1 Tax=Paracraurococcus ruber TaxID=77675 RepID=A0ABS1CZ35_9PROT|nr:ATP-binding cassette domain-containing protein [Paracraurococcus ruber]MBK1659786.1 aliphatic sulfonate ABC transporter ATP-binding protein [Paracraurococcus ruber]TDG32759.1 ATP-binding cassette domain-containing protein [Paracraurococcus ruber]